MSKNILILIIAVVIIGGIAYWSMHNKNPDVNTNTGEMPVTPDQNGNLPVEPAAAAARQDLATKLSVDEKSIVITNISEATWTDGCLGLGGPTESCLQALVPGFKVQMMANGKTYFYRTDKTGMTVRAEAQVSAGNPVLQGELPDK